MNRLKIDYGIDLGTTNSAICRMDKGNVSVMKIEVTDETMPSCVYFNKKKSIIVGRQAYNTMKSDKRRATKKWDAGESNTFIEFKRTMGTTTEYNSSNMGRSYSSEELSAEVLKALKSFVQDDEVRSAIITVPAKFTQNQKDATMRAAKLAGFEHCELLQEPIAASMAYGLSSEEKDGLWLVFDFGGGTFDAALVKSEDGIMKVFDTEGDNYLGGKNLDEAIVDEVIIPYLQEHYVIDEILADDKKKKVLRDAMKTYAEDLKNNLSFKASEDVISNLGDLGEDDEGEEIELDFSLTQEELEKVISPIFQRAVDICIKLLERNNLSGNQLTKVILVGGPTHSPVIRRMLKEQITPKVDTSIDPMTVVATGAALYASTIDNKAEVKTEVGTVKLNVQYEATSVETTEYVTVKLDSKGFDKVFVELTRGDKAWSSGRKEINAIGDVIDVDLVEGRSNAFIISAYDQQGNSLPCFPNEITIIQGTKVGNAPLAYNVGMEIWSDNKQMGVFQHFNGLEKNKPLPAVGTINGLKTTSALRPGNVNDFIQIPIYEAEYDSDGERATLFNHTYTLLITGENVPQLIPEGSDVDLTLKCADSGWELSVYFPSIDYTEELNVPKDTKQDVTKEYLRNEILKGQSTIAKLRKDGGDVSDAEEALDAVKKELDNGSEKHQVLTHLREALRKVDQCAAEAEWPTTEKKLRAAMKMLEDDNAKYGNPQTTKQVEEIRKQVNAVLLSKNIPLANDLLDAMHSLNFQIARVEYYVAWIVDWNERFDVINWKDKTRARQLVNQGMAKIIASTNANALQPIVSELINLLPPYDVPAGAGGLLGAN